MSSAVPIVRDDRSVDLNAAPGQTVFTFDKPLFDTADLTVWAKVAPATVFTQVLSGFVIAPLAGGNAGADVIWIAPPRATSGSPVTTIRLESRRLDMRITDVTRGGKLHGTSVDRQLDIHTTVMQELRRDLDSLLPGGSSGGYQPTQPVITVESEWAPVSGQGWYGLATITNRGSGYTNGVHVISLTVGAGTAPTVEAIVEGGKLYRIRWLTAGANITTAPTFPWASLPGGGTPGTVSLSLADGGVYRRNVDNQVEARAHFLRHGEVLPEWYGAIGNQTGDDAPAWNNCFEFLRITEKFLQWVHHSIRGRDGARYNLQTTVNATGLRSQRVDVKGSFLMHARMVDGIAVDGRYSQNVNWPIFLYGNTLDAGGTGSPAYGLVLSDRGQDSSAWWNLTGARIVGFFTNACIYNGGSELMTSGVAHIINSKPGGHAVILDCENAENPPSAFEELTETAATWEPMSQIHFGPNARLSCYDADAIKVIGYLPALVLDNCYCAVFNGSIIGLYNPLSGGDIEASTSMKLFVRGEPRTHPSTKVLKSLIKYYGDSGNYVIRDLEIRDYGFDYTVGVIERIGAGTLTIDALDMTVGAITDGGAKPAVGGGIIVRSGRMALTGSQANADDLSGFDTLRLNYFISRFAKAALTLPATYGFWLHTAGGDPEWISSANQLAVGPRLIMDAIHMRTHSGQPESVITAPVGSLLSPSVQSQAAMYSKRTGTGNTGWAAHFGWDNGTKTSLVSGTPRVILAAGETGSFWEVLAWYYGTSGGSATLLHAFVAGDTTPLILNKQKIGALGLDIAVAGTNIEMTLASGTALIASMTRKIVWPFA